MIRILISACLLGEPVRYNGRSATVRHPQLTAWRQEGRLVRVCPECLGGLPTPRPPAEISPGDGRGVLLGDAQVYTQAGADFTEVFHRGAELTLAIARRHHCRLGILKDRSPSCASQSIYDGSFSGRQRSGIGVTTALLEQHGIRVFSEQQIDAAVAYLASLAQTDPR